MKNASVKIYILAATHLKLDPVLGSGIPFLGVKVKQGESVILLLFKINL